MKLSGRNAFDDNKLLLRLLVTTFAGLLVAGFLTWFMFVLIQFGEKKVDESKRVQLLDFVRLKREESSVNKERRAERPQTAEPPPAPSTPDFNDAQGDGDVIGITDLPVQMDMNVDVSGIGAGISEGEFLPIVKVAPVYPSSAANRGIEGQCMVEYTVTVTGATKNIRVVDGECSYAGFRKPSIAAAERFKYKPRIINGEAVEVERVRNMFIFTLQKAEQGNN